MRKQVTHKFYCCNVPIIIFIDNLIRTYSKAATLPLRVFRVCISYISHGIVCICVNCIRSCELYLKRHVNCELKVFAAFATRESEFTSSSSAAAQHTFATTADANDVPRDVRGQRRRRLFLDQKRLSLNHSSYSFVCLFFLSVQRRRTRSEEE